MRRVFRENTSILSCSKSYQNDVRFFINIYYTTMYTTLSLIFIGMHSVIHILVIKVNRKCVFKHDSDSTVNYSE